MMIGAYLLQAVDIGVRVTAEQFDLMIAKSFAGAKMREQQQWKSLSGMGEFKQARLG